jgi:glycosyltransferase involved in cell wall biosynthesis
MCTIHITSSIEDLNKLFSPNYHLLVTYGDSYDEYHNSIADKIPHRFSGRWFHKTDISNIAEFNHNVNYCYITNVINIREKTRPVFSIFTTCFKSYDYIDTAYKSIKKQSLIDWEWVIMDDTPEDEHFVFLKNKLSSDNRVRLYKRDKNSGSIGNVKNEVISLCRGKYILEMDHDDEILSDCLLDSYNIFQSDENIGFVYADTVHLYRDGRDFNYGDFICKGYGGYYMEKVRDKWVYVYNTPNINNITLSHLVCLPNHPRIWKRSVLMELESYSEFLPICDDYEILLRTCCSKYKVVKNNKAQYIQYMNDGGNNFSNIRNAEINRLGPKYISPMFYEKYNVHNKMKECDAYEDEIYIVNHSPIWKRGEKYQHKKKNQRINMNYDKQYCIINGAIDNMDTVDRLKELYKNERNDFLVLSNRMTHEELQHKLESYGFDRMKCYSYTDCLEEELINYFKMMYKNDNCEHEVIQSENDLCNNFITNNTSLTTRHEVVNTIIGTYNYNSYLEIGVENGFTFKNIKLDMSKKVGVDPDPTYKEDNIILKISDDFFKENNKIFDIIFIDGMHQLEYVYNDFFNAINCLTPQGSIVIDDVLPMNEREQYKVPIKHYYNNGILKYGESWTGDVWKFIYFLLLHYQFDFSVYNFTNGYRGMIHIYNFKNEINNEIDNTKVIETMNSYEYNKDYDKYLKCINARRKVLTANSQKIGYWRPKKRPIGVKGVVLA